MDRIASSLEIHEFDVYERGIRQPSIKRLSIACDLIEKAISEVASKNGTTHDAEDEEFRHRRSEYYLHQALNVMRGDLGVALRIPPDSEMEVDLPSGIECDEYAEQRFWMIPEMITGHD